MKSIKCDYYVSLIYHCYLYSFQSIFKAKIYKKSNHFRKKKYDTCILMILFQLETYFDFVSRHQLMYVLALIGFNMCALQKFNANVLSEPKHKKKKPIPTSTDESESKIAFVKKKAKRAKVFLKEKLTDHSNSTDGSKPYRQNDVRQIAFILIITQVGRILN